MSTEDAPSNPIESVPDDLAPSLPEVESSVVSAADADPLQGTLSTSEITAATVVEDPLSASDVFGDFTNVGSYGEQLAGGYSASEDNEDLPFSAGAGSSRRANPPIDDAEHGVIQAFISEQTEMQNERRAETERARESTHALHAQALEEEQRLKAFSDLMVARLEAGRTVCEAMARLLKGMAAAEGTYAKACSKLTQSAVVSGGGDGTDALFAACEATGVLPRAAAGAHRQAEDTLLTAAGEVLSCGEASQREMKALVQGTKERMAGSEKARAALHTALAAVERSATRAAQVMEKRTMGGGQSSAGPAEDPWLAECVLLDHHLNLNRTQEAARAMLATASERVIQLEQQRVEALNAVLGTTVGAYQRMVAGLHESVSGVAGVLEAARAEAPSQASALASAAQTATLQLTAVAAQQAERLQTHTDEVFNSAHILRQGTLVRDMASTSAAPAPAAAAAAGAGSDPRRDSFVILSSSGFLHWFDQEDRVVPVDGVKLARCTIDAADTHAFTLTEARQGVMGKARKLTFQTVGGEDCMEWVLAIKEAILDNTPGKHKK